MIVFFYYILLSLFHVFLSIPLLLLSFLKQKYKNSIKARFFLYKNSLQEAQVHFHACSFGEIRSIAPLLDSFNDVRVSCITQTGFDEASKKCKKVNFLAFETLLPFWFKPCKVLVLFEAELWLMLVFMAKLRGAKVILLNARISDKSFNRYKKFSFFYRKVFSYIDEVFAQSKLDKQRLEELGAKNVHEFFNIKACANLEANKHYKKNDKELILFASTHEKEDELLLENFTLNSKQRLIIAPRHPERFKNLELFLKQYCKKHSLTFSKFSEFDNFDANFASDILLVDILGELINLYLISDIVVLGGSFIKGIGGHNPVEPATFNKIIISGPFIHNQKALFCLVDNIYICEDVALLNEIINKADKKAMLNFKPSLKPIKDSIKAALV